MRHFSYQLSVNSDFWLMSLQAIAKQSQSVAIASLSLAMTQLILHSYLG
ncbi:MAG: hypothetical protein AAFQ91_33885 [Cyanobacteria bacterium J06621_15]